MLSEWSGKTNNKNPDHPDLEILFTYLSLKTTSEEWSGRYEEEPDHPNYRLVIYFFLSQNYDLMSNEDDIHLFYTLHLW